MSVGRECQYGGDVSRETGVKWGVKSISEHNISILV